MRALILLAALVALALLSLPSCCSCAPLGFRIDSACEEVLARVVDIDLSGACSDATLERGRPDARWYSVTPKRAGTCHVSVLFDDGTTFEKDVVVEDSTGSCCPGLYGTHVELPGSCVDAGL